MAFEAKAFVAKIKEHTRLRETFLRIPTDDPLRADERFTADQALRKCEIEIAAMTRFNMAPSKDVSISILNTFFSDDKENLIECIIDGTVSHVCPLEYLLSFCREHVDNSFLIPAINANLGLGISGGRDTEDDIANYPLNERKKRDQVWAWLQRRGTPGYVDQKLHSTVITSFSAVLNQKIDQEKLRLLQLSEQPPQPPLPPPAEMSPQDFSHLFPASPAPSDTSWTWREWTRFIIGLAVTALVLAILFSSFGTAIPFAAGIIAWVGSAGWTMAVGVAASVALGSAVALFDYVAGFAVWLVAEVLIGTLSFFASLFSTLAGAGLGLVKGTVLSLGVLFGVLNKENLSDADNTQVTAIAEPWEKMATPVRFFFTGLFGVLAFCIGASFFLAFSIPALILSGIVDLSDQAKGISWVHQSAMALHHFFTRILDKIKGTAPSPAKNVPQTLSPTAHAEPLDIELETSKTDSGKISKQRAELPSLRGTHFFSFFDALSKRNSAHFKEVVTEHATEENPRHAESSRK